MDSHDDLQDLETSAETAAEVTGGGRIPPGGRLVSPEFNARAIDVAEVDPDVSHAEGPDGVGFDNGKVGVEAGRRERGVGGSIRVGETEQEVGTGN